MLFPVIQHPLHLSQTLLIFLNPGDVEWSRPFGLDVLVLSLDPIYNVFS